MSEQVDEKQVAAWLAARGLKTVDVSGAYKGEQFTEQELADWLGARGWSLVLYQAPVYDFEGRRLLADGVFKAEKRLASGAITREESGSAAGLVKSVGLTDADLARRPVAAPVEAPAPAGPVTVNVVLDGGVVKLVEPETNRVLHEFSAPPEAA